jgi:PPOX class probable F420-dependent enzyme
VIVLRTPLAHRSVETIFQLYWKYGRIGIGVNYVAVPAGYDDLLERPLYGHLATTRPDGSVQVSPIWFDWDGELLRFAHTTKRQKYRNVQRNPRVDGGSVILIGSTAGYLGIRGYSAYSATKAALRSYTRTWTRESNDRGIRFNTLSPGPIDTAMLDGQADKAQFAAAVPLNRLGRPEEIAAAALFLASDDSSFVAGVELSVDGGMAQV